MPSQSSSEDDSSSLSSPPEFLGVVAGKKKQAAAPPNTALSKKKAPPALPTQPKRTSPRHQKLASKQRQQQTLPVEAELDEDHEEVSEKSSPVIASNKKYKKTSKTSQQQQRPTRTSPRKTAQKTKRLAPPEIKNEEEEEEEEAEEEFEELANALSDAEDAIGRFHANYKQSTKTNEGSLKLPAKKTLAGRPTKKTKSYNNGAIKKINNSSGDRDGKGRRGKNWTELEVLLLTHAYINATQDLIKGANNRTSSFWAKVESNMEDLWGKRKNMRHPLILRIPRTKWNGQPKIETHSLLAESGGKFCHKSEFSIPFTTQLTS